MAAEDTDQSGNLSLIEWLAYVKKLSDKNQKSASAVLRLYEKQINSNRNFVLNSADNQAEGTAWPLRAEAVRIFELADKDRSGSIDMKELANLRSNGECADAMMAVVDTDHSGNLSLSEWLAYVKKLSEKNQKSAAAVLRLYEKQINSNKTFETNN